MLFCARKKIGLFFEMAVAQWAKIGLVDLYLAPINSRETAFSKARCTYVFGPITMAWGVLLYFLMPTSPMTAWFLTERERKSSVMRVGPAYEKQPQQT